MKVIDTNVMTRPMMTLLLASTMLGGFAGTAMAQSKAPRKAAAKVAAPATSAPARPAPAAPAVSASAVSTIRAIEVSGQQRLERDTVLSYTRLRVGGSYTQETLDNALRDLFETELFADVQIRDADGALTIVVKENPVINRIVLEGNKRIKEDKIRPEIKMQARQIYTRSKVRADVARIVELYRRQGRFAATVEPKMVQLDQNRVDIVFEINEGPKSKVRQINIIGNKVFSDSDLRDEMATKSASVSRVFSSATSYDPDRLAYDQQKLRQFYLTKGYADFRVISAVAELTPDKQDFIITYVVEEGERYKYGDVSVKSEIRDLPGASLEKQLPKLMSKGAWYNAKLVEETVDQLNETAGLYGYAFIDVQPDFIRDKDARTMGVTFQISNAPRVYVERIDINGNTLTQDKVVRREFRLNEGDAFNSFQVKRSKDRIASLGFFQDKLDVEQKPGSAPDRIVLETNVEEKSTGELSLSAGYSSLERFIIAASVTQRNFRGKGQELRTSVNHSLYSKSFQVGFTEPYFMDKNVALGGDIYRRDYNSFSYVNGSRTTTYKQTTTGFQVRAGMPLTEYSTLVLRYSLNFEKVRLDQAQYYTSGSCDPLKAGRYLCDAIGDRTASTIGYSLIFDTRDNRLRPTRGHNIEFSQDLAGLGGNARYIRSRIEAGQYFALGHGFTFALTGEGGYIHSFEKATSATVDKVRLTDRFFLGEPEMRGFDIRGIGPRVHRTYLNADGTTYTQTDDALGGRAYYLAHAEIQIPLGSAAREMGLRPSVFVDAGAVAGLRNPALTSSPGLCYSDSTMASTITASGVGTCAGGDNTLYVNGSGFTEAFYGNTLRPRVSVGFGISWNSPFGPFRIDFAKALMKQPGDDLKTVTFNIGTQF